MCPASLPFVRLKPKVDPRPIRHGHPWVFSDQLVLDRRSKALPPGSLAVLEDAERNALGVVAMSPASRIAARMLDRDPAARIGRDWLAAKVRAAQSLRNCLYDAPFYRLVHAEGDGLPGIVIDRFGDAAVVQPNAAWSERLFDDLADVLGEVAGVTALVKNAGGRTRGLEGLDAESGVVFGVLDGPIPVPMNGATYLADLMGGQKTGLFYDQRPNHAFTARLARGRDVLDVFAHVGGFALAALAAGATSALAVDGSDPALTLARAGAEASGLSDRFETMKADAFDALTALGDEGRRFGTVICDPPAFAPSKTALTQGLRAYERIARLAAPLVEPGGFLTLCSCSHAADLPKFRNACTRGIGRAGRLAQILRTGHAGPDHPMHPALPESGYLKALTFRLT